MTTREKTGIALRFGGLPAMGSERNNMQRRQDWVVKYQLALEQQTERSAPGLRKDLFDYILDFLKVMNAMKTLFDAAFGVDYQRCRQGKHPVLFGDFDRVDKIQVPNLMVLDEHCDFFLFAGHVNIDAYNDEPGVLIFVPELANNRQHFNAGLAVNRAENNQHAFSAKRCRADLLLGDKIIQGKINKIFGLCVRKQKRGQDQACQNQGLKQLPYHRH